MTKEKTIIVKWSKKEKDINYFWGNGISKCDVSLIHSALSYNLALDREKDMFSGLLPELEKRGYDITSFRLTVKKKKECESVNLSQK